ncbi:DUF2637 domain-containing protein [Streptomyces sp. NPDC092952]|uniref:DUF2637 domain-containing protein n=1 Tax=Streptomyces sp. NPDC092952 TaxID=3366018 RepID=UPI00381B23B5
MQLTRTHRILIGLVVAGAVLIAAIGFAGSYAAVRELAEKKGFGDFSLVFPIGIDAGICVLLALDLLLTWLRIPFPLLRQTAWMLTAATIAFNGAAAWPDPLGVGMHAVIPVLFVVSVEAARHAVGRIADITADKHMEGVRLTRWLLSPVPTFRLWRRMKLWELRSYEQVIKLEQDRLVYQARLQARFGRNWRRRAPVESLMPLRLAKYGVPLAETAAAGLAAAGVEPQLLPPQPVTVAPELGPQLGLELESKPVQAVAPVPAVAVAPQEPVPAAPAQEQIPVPVPAPVPASVQPAQEGQSQWFSAPRNTPYQGGYDPNYDPASQQSHPSQAPQIPQPRAAEPEPGPEPVQEQPPAQQPQEQQPPQEPQPEPEPHVQVPNGAGGTRPLGEGTPATTPSDEELYEVFRYSIAGEGMPTPGAFAANVEATYGLRLQSRKLNQYMDRFSARFNNELMEDHIA